MTSDKIASTSLSVFAPPSQLPSHACPSELPTKTTNTAAKAVVDIKMSAFLEAITVITNENIKLIKVIATSLDTILLTLYKIRMDRAGNTADRIMQTIFPIITITCM